MNWRGDGNGDENRYEDRDEGGNGSENMDENGEEGKEEKELGELVKLEVGRKTQERGRHRLVISAGRPDAPASRSHHAKYQNSKP